MASCMLMESWLLTSMCFLKKKKQPCQVQNCDDHSWSKTVFIHWRSCLKSGLMCCVFHWDQFCLAADLIICLAVCTHSVYFCPCLELNSVHNSRWIAVWLSKERKIGRKKKRKKEETHLLCLKWERRFCNEGLHIQAHSSVSTNGPICKLPAFILLLTVAVIPHSVWAPHITS